MSDVPSDLYREILLRLPAECLLLCRAVCRAWCCIIDDPSFIKSHTLTHHSSNSSSSLLIRDCTCFRLYYLSLHSLTYADHHAQQTADLIPIKNLVVGGGAVRGLRDQRMISCHGLLLLYYSNFNKDLVIRNPLTRDFLRLSEPEDTHSSELESVGLGYDYVADDYKVVRIDNWYREGELVRKTHVYSLKSRTWKVIKNCPSNLMSLGSFADYLNGALYWITMTVMVALDLATEEYRLLPLPLFPAEPSEVLNIDLEALDGCLLFSYCYLRFDAFHADECLDVWIMKDEISVETPWIKLLSLVEEDDEEEEDGGNGMSLRILRLVAYSKSRGEVLMHHGTHFYCFDVGNNCKKKVTVEGLPERFTCQNYQGSLVRIVDDEDGSAAA